MQLNMKRSGASRLFYMVLFVACALKPLAQSLQKVDLIIYNAKVYTVDERFSVAQAVAVNNGKIESVGTSAEIMRHFSSDASVDARGKFLYPGFIDAHAHFYGYGQSLLQADLTGATSWAETVDRVKAFALEHPDGWLTGRGWNQNLWKDHSFPDKALLDQFFPDRPVYLTRIDGHAAIVNQAAIKLSGVQPGQKIEGGEIETKNGKLTGVLVDNATRLVSSYLPKADAAYAKAVLTAAQKNCFAAGLTTVVDCGLDFPVVDFIQTLHRSGDLKMRLNIMLSDDSLNYVYLFKKGIIHTDRLTVRSFKLYADGALGSRGACLLEPYSDRPGHYGFLLKNKERYRELIAKMADKGFQLCTHAIGDSANRVILRLYASALKGKNDLRWRIEHAQVINPADFDLFGKYSIIPSVQPTHATSDMNWAVDRLGKERVKGAYAYKQLLDQNGWIPLGTDFPVEQISPILTFYAAVVRKDPAGFPVQGFQPENALSRVQTLRGMTIWAAKGHFEEKEKGSIEVGKVADFVLLDQDLMDVAPDKILQTRVLATFLGGEKVFENND